MRKKELRTRNEILRQESAEANQLAANQVKRVNELRMQIAFLERDLDAAPNHNDNGHASIHGTTTSPAQESDLKACPDCAENVRTAARKCRYCGYRFDAVELSWSGDPSGATSNGSASVAQLGTASGR